MANNQLLDDDYPQKIDSKFVWSKFELMSSSSTNYGTDFDFLNKSITDHMKNWESRRLPDYPITVVLKLHTILDLDFLLLSAKKGKEIDELEIYVGLNDKLDDFRLCGLAY